MSRGAVEWLAANGIALLLLIAALLGWSRDRPQARRRVVMALSSTALLGAGLWLLAPRPLPVGWVTVLMEGRSARNVGQLYGHGAHVGAGFEILVDLLAGADPPTLLNVVRFNAGLALINGLLFFWLALYVLRAWWAALAFAVLAVINLNSAHAALSETPAVLWTTYFWIGCVVAAIAADTATGAAPRWLALACLACVVGLAASLRQELLIIGAPALGLAVLRALGYGSAVRIAAARAGAALQALFAGPLWRLLLVVGLLLLAQLRPWMSHLSYLIDGVDPMQWTFLWLPVKLASFLPMAFLALFVFGFVYTLRHCSAFLLLPITVLVLFKVYASATQGALENFRYMTFVTPMAFFIALFGFAQLTDWATRWTWPAWWRRPALLLLIVAMPVWQPLGPRELFDPHQTLPGIATPPMLLGRNQQSEVRYLLDAIRRYPHCVLLSKAPVADVASTEPPRYRWLAFGLPLAHMLEQPHAGETPEHIAAQLSPRPPCVLLYRSLDCNLAETDGCEPELRDRAPIEQLELPNLPFSDPRSYGVHRPVLHLGLYAVTGEASARPQGLSRP